MRVLFLVQGEGRGHLTQAIALGQILREAGYDIIGAMVGSGVSRTIPSFFREQVQAPVLEFNAPVIKYRKDGRGMDVRRTLLALITNCRTYLNGLQTIDKTVKELKPDLIVSFYETYSGLYNIMYRPKVPMVCIAHQYLLLHPDFVFPKNSRLSRWLINLNSSAASWMSKNRLALSFREIPSRPDLKITVVPPLLRQELFNQTVTSGDFFLVYMTHHSLSKQVIEWHKLHPEVKLNCFWDKSDAPSVWEYDETLTFHTIDSEKYLRMLGSCKALVSTAGFESVCEAMYLGKPVMMVPVPNHFEQECNAMDGVSAGAGISSESFDLSVLVDYLPGHRDHSGEFREWYGKGKAVFLNQIARALKTDQTVYSAPPGYSQDVFLSTE